MALHEPVTATESEQAQLEALGKLLGSGPAELAGAGCAGRIALPASVHRILQDVVGNMQRGRTILMIPEDAELTTQRAAKILAVSRPHLIKVLESGGIPFHKTGNHRRIRLRDVLAYSKKRDAERKAILDDLAKEAFAAGLYDDACMPEGGQDE